MANYHIAIPLDNDSFVIVSAGHRPTTNTKQRASLMQTLVPKHLPLRASIRDYIRQILGSWHKMNMTARIRRLRKCFIQVKGQNENRTSQTNQIAFMIKRPSN